ncbi:hypothetical protein [Mesonia phycicola]|uniref:hypothetical protein n=1 Tax=Mesonia phycicola TaxID=579105 RepID=UPI002936F92B|nr:hypothetical protein [Mesonia phycicola]
MSKSSGLTLQSRVTKGVKEVLKRRAHEFFKLKAGEFIAFADGKDRKIRFNLENINIENRRTKFEVSLERQTIIYRSIYEDLNNIFKN